MKIDLPYGKKSLTVDVSENNLAGVIKPTEIIPPDKEEVLIKEAIDNPLGSSKLSEFVKRGDRIAIVVDDYTRPCPNEKLLLPVLKELKQAGIVDSDIKIIVATGTHSPPDYEKIKEIVGDKVSRNYNVVSNTQKNAEHISVGESKNGNPIEILREYLEADIKIILGDIEYHYFAGYGGTRKSILPGISSEKTIQNNHCMLFEKNSKTGKLKENNLSLEMFEALRIAGCDFCLNVVLNSNHKIVGAWAGRPESVMDAGVKLVDSMYKKTISEKPDIVIVSANGHPHDINLYQAMKALHTAAQITKKDGVIILVAECPEGHGSDLYMDWLKKFKTSEEVQKGLEDNFIIGAHKAYYHRKAVEDFTVFFVSSIDKTCAMNDFDFKCVDNPNEGLKKAFSLKGLDSKVIVLPLGTTTFIEVE